MAEVMIENPNMIYHSTKLVRMSNEQNPSGKDDPPSSKEQENG
jgi:hypothetical protein